MNVGRDLKLIGGYIYIYIYMCVCVCDGEGWCLRGTNVLYRGHRGYRTIREESERGNERSRVLF